MTKKILTIIILLGFSFTSMGLWAGSAGLLPDANLEQEKTEKKEEEKNKEEKEKKPQRVWTDEDLKKVKKEKLNITEVPSKSNEKSQSKTKSSSTPYLLRSSDQKKAGDPKTTEEYWRNRKRTLVENIKNHEEDIKKMEQKIFDLRNERDGTDIVSDRIRLSGEIDEYYKRIEDYKRGLARMQKELEDLPNEARRAGALPGWLRDK